MFGIRRCNQKNLNRAPDLLRGAKSGEETMKKAWLISAALLLTFAASEAIAIQPPASCEDQGGRVINVPIVAAINGHRIPVSYINTHYNGYPYTTRIPICHFRGHNNPENGGDFLIDNGPK